MKKYKVTTSYLLSSGDISDNDDWLFDTKEEAQKFVDKFHTAFPKDTNNTSDPYISSVRPEIQEVEIKDPYEWLEHQIKLKERRTKEEQERRLSELESLGIKLEEGIATFPSTYDKKIWVLHQGKQTVKIGIPREAFKDMNLKEVHIEDSPVEAFGYDCFTGNDNVTIYAKKQPYNCYPQNAYFIQEHIKYVK